MNYNSLGNSISFSPVKSKGATLAGPIISLKKFCESLPSSQSKPSGLNMIRWRKRIYSPTDKERRMKLENDAIRHKLAQESGCVRRGHSRTHSRTEPNQPLPSYQQEFQKIMRKELSADLISKDEEEVFANIKEDSMREEFKRNHANVWNFIVKKKKPSLIEADMTTNLKSLRERQAKAEINQLEKSRLNQRLKSYIKKWHPSPNKILDQSRTTPIKKHTSQKKNTIQTA